MVSAISTGSSPIITIIVNCSFDQSDHHASLISPLINLIKQGVPWKFGEQELKMFNRVKQSFTEQYISHPLFDQVFYLQTDESKLGLGAELFQLASDGERRTILFASRTPNSAEQNYSITELELLSVVFACEKFRVFILGYPVQVLTDHQALIFSSSVVWGMRVFVDFANVPKLNVIL